MISKKSLINFIFINSYLILLSTLYYYLISNYLIIYKNLDLIKFYSLFIPLNYLLIIIKNYILLYTIDYLLKDKEYISKRRYPNESYKGEFNICILIAGLVENLTYLFINPLIEIESNILNDLLLFISTSFIFELIFDFFHYWFHRLCHMNKYLYILIHKKHHKYNYTVPIIAFYQDYKDLIITNSIPTFLTLKIMPKMSLYMILLISFYKMFIEIGGHSGKKINASSFPQLIWLPRLLNIHLKTENHDLHHIKGKCNYSKRFSIYDKIFGTFSIL